MKRLTRLPAVLVGILLFVSFSYSGSSAASEDNDNIDSLKQKITELEKRVKDLEAILKIYHGPKNEKSGETNSWLNKKTWRHLKKGMTSDQVKKILGEPVKVIEGSKTIWYYPSFYGNYVSFDEEGKLAGWNEP